LPGFVNLLANSEPLLEIFSPVITLGDVGCTAGAAGATVGAAETGVPCNCTGDVGAAGVAICGAAKGTGV
jgi:hypothetical protein